MITKSEIPQSKYDTMFKYSKHNYVGSSFLVHPDVLLYNSYKHPYKEIATYLAAASIRNIAEYIANQTTTLELLHVPAQKNSILSYTYKDGDNKVRIVGDILARYVYWIEGTNGKNIPFECLSFDRDSERFNNKEKDWIREYFPDLKCGWSRL